MTLLELLRGTLEQLDRGTDAQTIEAWRDKLTRYLNDALFDLAAAAAPKRTDTLTLTNHALALASLPKRCVKVLALSRNDRRWPFYYGGETSVLFVPNLNDGDITVTYRYTPDGMAIDTDVPDLPAQYHSALILYAVGRERAMGDSASIAAARACFELYYAIKRGIRASCGELDGYAIENRY